MVCLPSNHGVGARVMKNWDPFVFGLQTKGSVRDTKTTTALDVPRVGHAQNACSRVFERGCDLVFELLPIDGCSATTSACGITTLNHEVGYDAVEDKAIEVIALRERGEVCACLGSVFCVQLDGDIALKTTVSMCTSTRRSGLSSLGYCKTYESSLKCDFGRHAGRWISLKGEEAAPVRDRDLLHRSDRCCPTKSRLS